MSVVIEERVSGPDGQEPSKGRGLWGKALAITARIAWRAAPGYSVLVLAIIVVSALIPPSIVRMGQRLVDGVLEAQRVPGQDHDALLLTIIVLGGLTAVQSGLNAVQASRNQVFTQRVFMKAEEGFLQVVSRADAGHFDDPSWHDRVQRANRSLWRTQTMLRSSMGIIGSVITVGGMLGILLSLHPILVLLALIAVLVPLPIERAVNRQVYAMRWSFTSRERERNYFRRVLSDTQYAKDLRAFNLEDHFLNRHRGVVAELHQRLVDLLAKANRNTVLVGVLSGSALAAAYGFASARGLVGQVTPGELTAVIGAVASIVGQMTGISAALIRIDEDSKYLNDYLDFLGLEKLVPLSSNPSPIPERVTEGITFERVWFSYPGVAEPALSGLDLHIRSGELMALVGDNGAGKTTLVKLLLRFYDPQEGSIRFSGVDLKDADPVALRERMGVLFQDPLELALSVRDNVGYGRPADEPSDERVWEALERAKITELVRGLPSGLDSKVGRLFEGGKDLSGGEWRRMALARLMFRGAEVWILDEPTSSLDPEAEAAIFAELKQNLRGRTGIVISHRFNTVRIADRIAVIQDGRVTELGTHEELIALGGRYAHLFELQATAYR